MKKKINPTVFVSALLTIIFCILTIITFTSVDYVKAKDKIEYLETQYEKYLDDEYSTYSEEKMVSAKNNLKTIETRGIVFASVCGCSILVLLVSIFNSKNKQANEIKSNCSQNGKEAVNTDELKKIKDLFDSGVITQEEFDAKKKQLLGL